MDVRIEVSSPVVYVLVALFVLANIALLVWAWRWMRRNPGLGRRP